MYEIGMIVNNFSKSNAIELIFVLNFQHRRWASDVMIFFSLACPLLPQLTTPIFEKIPKNQVFFNISTKNNQKWLNLLKKAAYYRAASIKYDFSSMTRPYEILLRIAQKCVYEIGMHV